VREIAGKDKAAFDKIYEGKQLPFVEVDHKAYEAVIDLTKFVDSIRKQKS
jgi:phosphonate transport system substrate-binding protein